MQENENCTHSWGNNAKITLLFKSNGSLYEVARDGNYQAGRHKLDNYADIRNELNLANGTDSRSKSSYKFFIKSIYN